jgi:hypothetical protein
VVKGAGVDEEHAVGALLADSLGEGAPIGWGDAEQAARVNVMAEAAQDNARRWRRANPLPGAIILHLSRRTGHYRTSTRNFARDVTTSDGQRASLGLRRSLLNDCDDGSLAAVVVPDHSPQTLPRRGEVIFELSDPTLGDLSLGTTTFPLEHQLTVDGVEISDPSAQLCPVPASDLGTKRDA